jgi:hypothetical protein
MRKPISCVISFVYLKHFLVWNMTNKGRLETVMQLQQNHSSLSAVTSSMSLELFQFVETDKRASLSGTSMD